MTFCIVGGTGTLGRALVKELLACGNPQDSITVISRDELKQSDMRKSWPDLKYVLGDVRDRRRIFEVIDHDVVFHTAALKQVDTIESNVGEAIKTNVLGAINVADACADLATSCVFCSTDKAVLPINAYGYTKGLSEKYFLSMRNQTTNYVVCRWGNVCGSRGSAIPFFVDKIRCGDRVPITDLRMTRFFMLIEDAASFMVDSIANTDNKTLIPEMKAAKITHVIAALAEILNSDFRLDEVGIRPGEKIHETLWTSHEKCINSNDPDIQYTHDELVDLLRPVVEAL